MVRVPLAQIRFQETVGHPAHCMCQRGHVAKLRARGLACFALQQRLPSWVWTVRRKACGLWEVTTHLEHRKRCLHALPRAELRRQQRRLR